MSEFNSNRRNNVPNRRRGDWDDELNPEQDLLAEQILENVNCTPIGQLLKKIASLPEVRKEKVLRIRRQLSRGRYDLNGHLDVALDKVLEELIL